MSRKTKTANAKKNFLSDNLSVNLMAAETCVEGEVKAKGDIRIDGTFKGTLMVEEKLIIGENGSIEGTVYCNNAEISGKINAKLFVRELLSIRATSELYGEVQTKKLAIEPGAIFECSCVMKGEIKQLQEKTSNEKSKKPEKSTL